MIHTDCGLSATDSKECQYLDSQGPSLDSSFYFLLISSAIFLQLVLSWFSHKLGFPPIFFRLKSQYMFLRMLILVHSPLSDHLLHWFHKAVTDVLLYQTSPSPYTVFQFQWQSHISFFHHLLISLIALSISSFLL